MKNKTISMSALTCSIGLAIFGGSATAATIYADDFSGSSSTNLGGQAPDTRPGTETWTATTGTQTTTNPLWRADGSIAGETSGIALRGAFLPFTPTVGNVYTYSLDINTTSGDWLAMGFAQGTGLTTNFYDAPTSAAAWLLDESGGNVQTFLGPGLAGGAGFTGTNAMHNYQIVLDTTPALWTATWYRDNVLLRATTAFSANPTITHIGIYKHDNAAGTVDNLSLTVVPEPSAALLGGLGLLALLRRRRN